MTKAHSGESKAFDLSPQVEFLLASAAVAALLLGAWGLFGVTPAPAVQSAELSSASLMPKLDHIDTVDPTGTFIIANALSHVATFKLPPDVLLLPGVSASDTFAPPGRR